MGNCESTHKCQFLPYPVFLSNKSPTLCVNELSNIKIEKINVKTDDVDLKKLPAALKNIGIGLDTSDKYYLNTTDTKIKNISIGSDKYIFNKPIKDDLSQGIILSNLYGINQDEMKLLSFDEEDEIDNIIEKIFENNIYIIIDVAAKFKDYKTEDIINKMIEIYKKSVNDNIKYFFYVDNSKKIKMKSILTGQVLDYSKKYENEVGGLYTQADIVGIDVQLGKTSGIAIFKEDTTFTKIVQGIGRLRKLTTIHDIHFMCNESIIENYSLTNSDKLNHQFLIGFFLANDKKEKESNRIYMYKRLSQYSIGKFIIWIRILANSYS